MVKRSLDPAAPLVICADKARRVGSAEAAVMVQRPIAKAAANDKTRFMILNPR